MKKILLVSGALLALCGLVVYGVFHLRNDSLPTGVIHGKDLAEHTPSTGDNAVSATPSSATTHTQSAPERPTVTITAPKLAAIREEITEEKTYYPLLVPNDPGYTGSWAPQRMNAPAAWDISTGSSDTVVAVLDSGYALNHEDLSSSWYVNPNESGTTTEGDPCWTGAAQDRSTNACDDDANGYVDDWRGWNFSLADNNPLAGRENPNGAAVSHGTHVAGLVGAGGNNATGITTLSWNTKVMPLQVLSDDGPGYTSDVVAAIRYAVDNGADVINMSLGSNEADAPLRAATDYAYANGVVVVAAAGNCGTGTEEGCSGYPAGYIGYPARNPHVISVGATTSSDQRASFSSYGDALDVVAPGSGLIYAPVWTAENGTSLYTSSLYGTSFSSPLVASLAALIKSVRPATSVDDITALIAGTAQKVNMGSSFYSTQYGHGIVDAHKALIVATALNQTSATPTLYMTGSSRSEHSYALNVTTASGCETETMQSYCTIWFQQAGTSYDRYLPYDLTDATSAYKSWQWQTTLLSERSWQLRAVQGEQLSTPYDVSRK